MPTAEVELGKGFQINGIRLWTPHRYSTCAVLHSIVFEGGILELEYSKKRTNKIVKILQIMSINDKPVQKKNN